MYKILEDLAKSLAQSSENPLYHIPYRLLVARGSGYKWKQPDAQNFSVGIFNWFGYTAKNKEKINPTLSVKHQVDNNCVYQSTTVQKEVDEGVELSEQSITIFAKIKGWVAGNGWSNTEYGQKAVKDYGINKLKDLPNTAKSWAEYSNAKLLTPQLQEKAKEHKSSTYWTVNSRSERLKLLDEGKILVVAMDWMTGFNQGGGFKAPWIISKKVGVSVGGHQFVIKGYKFGYYGYDVYVCQNSYGKGWGDKGDFYITMDYLDRNMYAGTCMAQLDINRSIADIVLQYAQKNVQGSNSKAIYHISMGKKRVYPDWRTFVAWDGYTNWFSVIPQDELDKVPNGDPMQFDTAPRKDLVENIDEPINWNYNKK